QVARAGVRIVQRLVEMPAMQLEAAETERMLEALVGAGDEAVERDRHVAGGCTHVRVDGAATQKASQPAASPAPARVRATWGAPSESTRRCPSVAPLLSSPNHTPTSPPRTFVPASVSTTTT